MCRSDEYREEEFEESKTETTRSLCSSASRVTSYHAFLLKGVICKHLDSHSRIVTIGRHLNLTSRGDNE
jgi:hypothetical protein